MPTSLTTAWHGCRRAGTALVFGALYCKSFARPPKGRGPKRSLSGSLDAAADEPGAALFDAEAQARTYLRH